MLINIGLRFAKGVSMNTGKHYDSLRCQECGKPLQPYRCGRCDGKGTTRYLLLFNRTCQICDGSGTLHRCPDELVHLRAIQAKVTSKLKGIKPIDIRRQSERKCQVCGGAGWVRRSIHIPRPTDVFPGYPRVYAEKRICCSNCNGRGWTA